MGSTLFVWCVKLTMDRFSVIHATRPDLAIQKSDFGFCFVVLGFMMVVRSFGMKVPLLKIGDWLLPKAKEQQDSPWTEVKRNDRIQRFSSVTMKFMYFCFITCWGYDILKDTPWLPPAMGGSGDFSRMWDTLLVVEFFPCLRRYFMVQMAYHIQSFIFFVCLKRRNDFFEMVLHHTCAILLVAFACCHGYERIGSIVFMLHDVADVFGYGAKMFVDTPYTNITVAFYVMLLFFWVYARLWVFPTLLLHLEYHHLAVAARSENVVMFRFLQTMLLTLQVLHVYWFTLFVRMGHRFLATGKTVDIQQRTGVCELVHQKEKKC
jgi:ceramide synthetase